MKDFRDKVVVITGAGSGIGRATALAFAKEGAKLHISDIDKERIEDVVKEARSGGAEATPYVVDCTSREEMEKFAENVFAEAGRVDILHNNAGIGTSCPFEKIPMEHWEKVIPGYMYTLQYEDMVSDQENETRKLLDFCNLPWDEACLSFHKTERSVKTPSLAQVRRPMYKDSVELWKRYEKQLEPLRNTIYGK